MGGSPVLLIVVKNGQQLVACCGPEAERAGVFPGMTLAHARALAPGARTADFDPDGDRRAMCRLAEWMLQFSPRVGVDACNARGGGPDETPDGLIIDATGCERLFGRPERMAARVMRALRSLGFTARAGVAASIGAAWALARFGEGGCGNENVATIDDLEERRVHAVIGPLPVRALRIDAALEGALAVVGVERIDQVLALPRRDLPSRFGPGLLTRIDQLFGRLPEDFEPVRREPPVRVECVFDGPTTQMEAVCLAVRDLLVELAAALLRREAGARVLAADFDRVGLRGTRTVRQVLTLSRACRDPRHLWSLLRPRVEKLHVGFGVEGVALVVLRVARLPHEQDEAWEGSGDKGGRGCAELLDALVNRMGEGRVLRAEAEESHVPERSFRMVAAGAEPRQRAVSTERKRRRGKQRRRPRGGVPPPLPGQEESIASTGSVGEMPTVATSPRPVGTEDSGSHAGPAARHRPTALLEHPEPVRAVALTPDHPPSALWWRGRQLNLLAGFGPERIGGEWWDAARTQGAGGPDAAGAGERDYFRVQDVTGRWLWVYRQLRTGEWFIHGAWV